MQSSGYYAEGRLPRHGRLSFGKAIMEEVPDCAKDSVSTLVHCILLNIVVGLNHHEPEGVRHTNLEQTLSNGSRPAQN